MTSLKLPQDMLQTAFMEGREKWNFSAFESVSGAFDAFVEDGIRGDKGFYGSVAVALLLVMDEREREEASTVMLAAMRRSKSGGTVMEHFRQMWRSRKVVVTPPAAEPTLPPSRQQNVESEIRKQALGMVDAQAKKEADQKGKKRAG